MVDERKKKILRFITEFSQAHGYQPNYREIAEHAGVVVSRAHQLLHELQDAGYIEMEPRASRTVRVVKSDEEE